jgi:hypothetical protein
LQGVWEATSPAWKALSSRGHIRPRIRSLCGLFHCCPVQQLPHRLAQKPFGPRRSPSICTLSSPYHKFTTVSCLRSPPMLEPRQCTATAAFIPHLSHNGVLPSSIDPAPPPSPSVLNQAPLPSSPSPLEAQSPSSPPPPYRTGIIRANMAHSTSASTIPLSLLISDLRAPTADVAYQQK